MSVPLLSIFGMGVSALLSIGVPICLLVFFHRKYGAKVVPALVGAAAFLVFALGLEREMRALVVQIQPDGSTWVTDYPRVFILYNLLAAAVFEETARFLSFKLLRKRYAGIRTALAYGVGHGGTKLILLGGVSTIATIAMSVAANAGQAGSSYDLLTFAGLQTTAATPPAMFLLAGVEHMFALAVHIALSVIVFYSVYAKRVRLYPLAIALHALANTPAAFVQAGMLNSTLAAVGLTFALSIALVVLAVYAHRRLKPALPDEAEGCATA